MISTRPLRASTSAPLRITDGASGTNRVVPGSLTSTVPRTGWAPTLVLRTGVGDRRRRRRHDGRGRGRHDRCGRRGRLGRRRLVLERARVAGGQLRPGDAALVERPPATVGDVDRGAVRRDLHRRGLQGLVGYEVQLRVRVDAAEIALVGVGRHVAAAVDRPAARDPAVRRTGDRPLTAVHRRRVAREDRALEGRPGAVGVDAADPGARRDRPREVARERHAAEHGWRGEVVGDRDSAAVAGLVVEERRVRHGDRDGVGRAGDVEPAARRGRGRARRAVAVDQALADRQRRADRSGPDRDATALLRAPAGDADAVERDVRATRDVEVAAGAAGDDASAQRQVLRSRPARRR